jgi:hypothetical protein
MTNLNDKFIGKVIAVRGIGSGINVGRCVAINGVDTLLEPNSFFCASWTYSSKSHGSFHSLANGDVQGGDITRIQRDTIITDTAQRVVCDEGLLDKLKSFAKD